MAPFKTILCQQSAHLLVCGHCVDTGSQFCSRSCLSPDIMDHQQKPYVCTCHGVSIKHAEAMMDKRELTVEPFQHQLLGLISEEPLARDIDKSLHSLVVEALEALAEIATATALCIGIDDEVAPSSPASSEFEAFVLHHPLEGSEELNRLRNAFTKDVQIDAEEWNKVRDIEHILAMFPIDSDDEDLKENDDIRFVIQAIRNMARDYVESSDELEKAHILVSMKNFHDSIDDIRDGIMFTKADEEDARNNPFRDPSEQDPSDQRDSECCSSVIYTPDTSDDVSSTDNQSVSTLDLDAPRGPSNTLVSSSTHSSEVEEDPFADNDSVWDWLNDSSATRYTSLRLSTASTPPPIQIRRISNTLPYTPNIISFFNDEEESAYYDDVPSLFTCWNEEVNSEVDLYEVDLYEVYEGEEEVEGMVPDVEEILGVWERGVSCIIC